jgi:hypothetical protein
MKKPLFSLLSFCIISLSVSFSQITPAEKGFLSITQDALKSQLGFLASDWTEGRMAGEKGESISADYIASLLQLSGVKPGGDLYQTIRLTTRSEISGRSYFQTFNLLKTIPGEEQILKIKTIDGQTIKTSIFSYNIDFTLRATSNNIEIEAPVAFAGYGFKNDKLKFNDLNKLDLKGKFLLKISGIPAFAREQITQADILSAEKELENFARSAGAIGIIEFNPNSTVVGNTAAKDFNNMSPSEGIPRPSRANAVYSIPGKKNPYNLIRITVSAKVANEILNGSEINLEDYIKKADSNTPYAFSPVTGKSVFLRSACTTSTVPVRNVIGIIEGNHPDEVIVLGAHYDHMGMSNGYVWNGADDNGSGTVGVLTLARAIMETGVKPEKTIVIALWTAEEEGLLGSRYYVQNLNCPLKNLKLNVNFDMISRYISSDEPKKVTMTYTNSCENFKEITVANLKKYGIDLMVDYQPSADPPGGTDHRSFVAVGIPIMRFKPGHREEYHTPGDELSTVNWDIMEKIIKISFANVWQIRNGSLTWKPIYIKI